MGRKVVCVNLSADDKPLVYAWIKGYVDLAYDVVERAMDMVLAYDGDNEDALAALNRAKSALSRVRSDYGLKMLGVVSGGEGEKLER